MPENRKRAVAGERTESPERAELAESTGYYERAVSYERTESPKRAVREENYRVQGASREA
jgi:hypothetical protein